MKALLPLLVIKDVLDTVVSFQRQMRYNVGKSESCTKGLKVDREYMSSGGERVSSERERDSTMANTCPESSFMLMYVFSKNTHTLL